VRSFVWSRNPVSALGGCRTKNMQLFTLNYHAKQTIIILLTEHCEIHFSISGWRFFEVHPTPVDPSVGFPDALHRQLGRIFGIPEERSSTQNLLVWPVLRLVDRFPSRVETATWHKFQRLYRSCVTVHSRDVFSTVLQILVLSLPNSQGVHLKKRRPSLWTR
jgi:hypothetical protein